MHLPPKYTPTSLRLPRSLQQFHLFRVFQVINMISLPDFDILRRKEPPPIVDLDFTTERWDSPSSARTSLNFLNFLLFI